MAPWVFGAVAVVAAACGGDDAADTTVPETTVQTVPDTTVPDTTVPDTTVPDTTVAGQTGEDTTGEDTMPDEQPAAVQRAISDLVERTGVDPGAVTVASFESVTWRDGSLGCPEPGLSYTQALVDGYRIELVVDGTSHWYHGARDGDPAWCADPSDPVEGGSGDT